MKSQFQFDEEVLYMNKSISRIIGVIMLIVAFVFIMFALNHPEKVFLGTIQLRGYCMVYIFL